MKFKYFLVLIEILFIMYMLWNRLFREKLPRTLPFSEYSCMILFFVCIILIVSLISFTLKKNNNITAILQRPLIELHTYLTEEFILSHYVVKVQNLIITILNAKIILIKASYILSKAITLGLVLLLSYELFYLNGIKHFYYVSIILLIPMFNHYLLFIFQKLFNGYAIMFDEVYYVLKSLTLKKNTTIFEALETTKNIELNAEEYFKELAKKRLNLIDNDALYQLKYSISIKENYIQKIKQEHIDKYGAIKKNQMLKYPTNHIDALKPYLEALSYINYSIQTIKETYLFDKITTIITIILYLINWIYVLIVSYPYINDFILFRDLLSYLANYAQMSDPFSDIKFIYVFSDLDIEYSIIKTIILIMIRIIVGIY